MDEKSRIIAILSNFGNDASGKEVLEAWQASDTCIETAVDIIQSATNTKVIFYAATVIRLKLSETIQTLDDSSLESLFGFLMEQITSGRDLGSGLTQMLKCAALIAGAKCEYMDQVSSLPPNYLILFFQFCIELTEKVTFFNYKELSDKINELIPMFLEIIGSADMSPDLLRFHASVISYLPFAECEPLFQRIVEASENRELYSSIFMILDAVMKADFSSNSPEDIVYIDNLVELMINITNTILAGECEITDYQFVSVVYRNIIDYGPEYFQYETHTETITNFFDIFLGILQRFKLEGLEDELFFLLDYAGNFVNYAVQINKENPQFLHFQIELLKFMIELVDMEQERFLTPDLEKSIQLITIKQKEITQFFTEGLSEPTPGIFYAIAYSDQTSRMVHASYASQVLIGMPEPPFTVVFFARTCAMYADESVALLLQLVYQFVEQMPIEVAKTISIIANRYYKIFIDNADDLINPMLEWIDPDETDFTAELISALFAIFTHVPTNDPAIEPILGQLEETVFAATTAEVEKDEVPNFIEFLVTIIKGVPKNLNAEFFPFFFQIYDKIHPLFEELWENKEYAGAFADLIRRCISHHWSNPEEYMEFYVQWLQNLFPENALPQHFGVLLYCAEYVDPSVISDILQGVNESEDQYLKISALEFSYKMVARVQTLLPVAMQEILYGMSLIDNQLLPFKAIESLNRILEIESLDLTEYVEQIVQLIIPIFLQNATDQEILYCCNVLYMLSKYTAPEEIAAAIVEAAGGTEEAQGYGEKLAAKIPPSNCLDEAIKMIGVFRGAQPES